MELMYRKRDPKRAPRVDSASFQTILNRDATTTGRHTNALTGAAKSNAWASTMFEMAHDDKHTCISEKQTNICRNGTDSSIITISRRKMRRLIQMKVKPAVETLQRKETRSVSRNLFEEAICDFFVTGFCAATRGIKNSFFSFVKNVILEIIYRGVLD